MSTLFNCLETVCIFISFRLIPKSLYQAMLEWRSAKTQTQQLREKNKNN